MTNSKSHIADFHRRLHAWYAAHGRRELPWRATSDAYAIYVSEIMLQQTQVKTVHERYYFQFLKRFPTLAQLAAAKREEVLKAWQGLGYYNRAVHLYEAARACNGALPQTVDGLLALPGIGRNTAHAVAAFAYRRPVAVMEANVRRVVSRIFALKTPDADTLWQKAAALLDEKNPFDYNQAMMDIGAMVCTKHAPKCGECPAGALCEGKSSPESYPAKARKKQVPVRKKHILVLRHKGRYFAQPRTGKFLNGMYGFVELDTPPPVGGREYLGRVRQQYSHFTLEAEVYLADAKKTGKDWYSRAALGKLPMSMAEQKILKLLDTA